MHKIVMSLGNELVIIFGDEDMHVFEEGELKKYKTLNVYRNDSYSWMPYRYAYHNGNYFIMDYTGEYRVFNSLTYEVSLYVSEADSNSHNRFLDFRYIFLKTRNISIINTFLIFTFIHLFPNHIDQLPQQAKLMLILFKLGQKVPSFSRPSYSPGPKGFCLFRLRSPSVWLTTLWWASSALSINMKTRE